MLQNKEEKLDKIYLVLLCIIIALLHLFIGSSHQEPKVILQTIIIIIGLTYIVIKRILNKKSQEPKSIVIKGKIDILMLLLLIASFMPLAIKSYYSLNDTINFLLAFICTYVVYILARNLVKTKKELNIVINVTLISSIMIVIFGLDKLYYNVFAKFLELINSAQSGAYGMISTVGYSNPVAVYMTLLSFFALGKYLCTQNKWIKGLYSVYIQMAMIGFAFGNSRALMLIFPVVFVAYLIVLKNNKNRMQSIFIMGINLVTAYIFQAVCDNLVTNNLTLWLAFALDLAIIYLITLAISKIIDKIHVKINKKLLLITVVTILILIASYCLVVKNIGEPIEVTETDRQLELLGLKNNYDYNIKINITAEIHENEEKMLNNNLANDIENKNTNTAQNGINSNKGANRRNLIRVACLSSQRGHDDPEDRIIQNGEQTLEFNIHTEDDFERVRIYIYLTENAQNKVTINHIYINGEEYIVSFKYLPNDIIRMIRTLNIRTVSIYERINFYLDSLKLAQNHLIFGAGGKTFANHIKPYQTYTHGYNEEAHSYIIDMLLNYGIFGLLIYIAILITTICTAIKTIKQKRKEQEGNLPLYISILFGIAMFTIHATIDFDLAYLFTLSMYYMFIGILNSQDNNLKANNFKYIDYAIVITLILALTITIPRAISNNFVKKEKYEIAYLICSYPEDTKYKIIDRAYKDGDKYPLEKYLPLYIKDEKYKKNFSIISKLNYVIEQNLSEGKYNKAIEHMEILYKYITENDNFSKVNENEIKYKNSLINKLLTEIERQENTLEDEQIKMWADKLKKLIN